MGRVDEYRIALRARSRSESEAYLLKNSGLPGPRANIDLGLAVAEEASAATIRRWSRLEDEYLAFCGTIGLGRLLAEGDPQAEGQLLKASQDQRWRVREAVAIALQRVGDADRSRLLSIARKWASHRSLFVRRAAVAGLCEPRLLDTSPMRKGALDVVEQLTGDMSEASKDERAQPPFQILRKALGYCWSVAVAASPDEGLKRFERWANTNDSDVRWVIRENLKKARMRKVIPHRLTELPDTSEV